jgi:predicted phosphodiesterase
MEKLKLYEFCKELLNQGNDWFEIHKQAIEKKLITKYVDANELRSICRDVAASLACGEAILDNSNYSHFEKQFFEFIKKKPSKFKKREKYLENNYKETFMVVSDLHLPYCDLDKLTDAIEEWSDKCDQLIVCGDLINGTQLSNWPKTVVEDFQQELISARVTMEYLSSKFKQVVILNDNHCHSRWMKKIQASFTPDLFFLIQHPYDYLVAGLDNVIRAGDTFEQFQNEIGWFHIVGDMLLAHAEVSSVNELKPVRNVQNFYNKWKDCLNLPEVNVFVEGHVHKLGVYYEYSKALIYPGCFVSMDGLKYALNPELKGTAPSYGYVILTQENGKTDLGSILVRKV